MLFSRLGLVLLLRVLVLTTIRCFSGSNVSVYETDGTGSVNYVSAAETSTNTIYIEQDPDNPGFPNAYADLSLATPPNILDVRRAFALQRYEEARARYGSRFVEYLTLFGHSPI